VCVAGQIVQDVLRPAERFPSINHPFVPVQQAEKLSKSPRLCQPRQRAVKTEFAPTIQPFQSVEELAAKDLAQDQPGQKESRGLGPHPSVAVGGEARTAQPSEDADG
jgi:hypothetical protein